MNQTIQPKKRLNHVISTWTTFAFILFFFYIIGDLLANWWHNAWWVWMILGFSLIGAISTTLRYLTSGAPHTYNEHTQGTDTSTSADFQTQTEVISEPVYPSEVDSKDFSPTSPKFCKNCGAAIESSSQFCASCGEEL